MPTNINADNGVVSGVAGLKTSADNSGVLALQTNGTTALTVNTSQNVGIGTTSPASLVHLQKSVVNGAVDLLVENTVASSFGSASISLKNDAAVSSGLSLMNSTRTTYGSITANSVGIYTSNTAGMFFMADGSGSIRFSAGGSAEIGRFDSSGSFLVGTTSAISAGKVSILGTSSTNTLCLQDGGSSNYNIRALNSGGTVTFNVLYNGNVTNTNNSYGAISDIKLKENIVDASPKLANLMQVKVRNYNLIGDTTKQLGVVAQELETVFPSMVEETPDQDAEGNNIGTTTKSVKYSVFVPMLIKAIQELKAEFDAYKASHP